MDPVSLQASNLLAARPMIALQGDLGAVLREGRVMAGEVLQSFGGGSMLIGIGAPLETFRVRPAGEFLQLTLQYCGSHPHHKKVLGALWRIEGVREVRALR